MSIKVTDLIKQAEGELLEEIEEMDIDKGCIERIKRRTMEKSRKHLALKLQVGREREALNLER